MFTALLGILGGIGSTAILGLIKSLGITAMEKYVGYLEKKMDSETERQKIDASVTIEALKAEIEMRRNARDIRIATAGFWEMRLLTFAIAFPFVWHEWMVFLDTSYGWYRDNCWWQNAKQVCGVPAFPAPFDEWQGAILLSFFGVQVGISVAQSVVKSIALKNRGK